ncbi:MAG: ABC transporter permease, partial [Bifidobacteriaceae bacterium]|nr:ABC transporter permease [Bifidobacteriaceae bacterium]
MINVTDLLAPAVLVILVLICGVLQPTVFSVYGLNLLLSAALPLTLAGLSQMFIILVGDIDLGNGYFIGLVSAVAAVFLKANPMLAVGIFVGLIAAYALAGALVQIRRIPALIVTLGASFIWLGIGLIILPIPGGTVPGWLIAVTTLQTPVIPYSILAAGLFGLIAYLITVRTVYGAVLRGGGGADSSIQKSGWSVLGMRMVSYALAAVFAIGAGLAVAGVTAGGDTQASANYTLLSIAAVILGGGRFTGGRAAPFGAVIGALAISVAGSMLALLGIPS